MRSGGGGGANSEALRPLSFVRSSDLGSLALLPFFFFWRVVVVVKRRVAAAAGTVGARSVAGRRPRRVARVDMARFGCFQVLGKRRLCSGTTGGNPRSTGERVGPPKSILSNGPKMSPGFTVSGCSMNSSSSGPGI